MPDLPTKTLSQAHYDRVVAAFPGATAAEKAAAYDDWLTNRLIERVEIVELRRLEQEAQDAKNMALVALKDSLPPKRTEPAESW